MTTKSKRRGWIIASSVFAALLALGIAVDVFGAAAPATKTAAAAATPVPVPAAGSCRQQLTAWQTSGGPRYFRMAEADAARVARRARAHQAAALRRAGAALAAAVRGGEAHPLPACLDTPGYYRAALADLSAAVRAAARGSFSAVLRWVRAARQFMTNAGNELAPAHRKHHHPAARPAPRSPAPAATSGPHPTARGCYPLSDAGNCYEPGQFCRAADQGVAGIAGDGETIVCEDSDGLRWVPTG